MDVENAPSEKRNFAKCTFSRATARVLRDAEKLATTSCCGRERWCGCLPSPFSVEAPRTAGALSPIESLISLCTPATGRVSRACGNLATTASRPVAAVWAFAVEYLLTAIFSVLSCKCSRIK
ncbi:hypothetical protein TNIN_47271 [Trichonephila inaurata madagascariensis]|uniref:Uncharacterized protein n=1 Tax=Trichonephila inaurata madagascariensis TaxID=2747483 RepID=A0A8X7C4D6_9ARAC|nr:hypothetical protein TNIN_47271 [Trichonephila inaurata madagascariensis]